MKIEFLNSKKKVTYKYYEQDEEVKTLYESWILVLNIDGTCTYNEKGVDEDNNGKEEEFNNELKNGKWAATRHGITISGDWVCHSTNVQDKKWSRAFNNNRLNGKFVTKS